ncbi:cysteine desulfurase [Venturia nashicola]|uniref:Cysteine desulfurase n=1 Tax=Venturia nashicola TaxID=86259 RepID=A0A4Z1P9V7_9PEZI|nr:cysteine desulfurase [Venturia nashicola]
MVMTLNIEDARSKFPSLKQKQVYFDNAGGSQTLGAVIESISEYLTNGQVQMGATYNVGVRSSGRVQNGREAGARYINAHTSETVIGPSTTQLLRNLASAIDWRPGDELILSKFDHETNIDPWTFIAERFGMTVRWWTCAPSSTPRMDIEDLNKLLSPKTRLVACTHASNILGTINDIKAIAETVHSVKGAMLMVDGVAYAPHRVIDVKHLGVDFYAFSWYKVYGPHIAMLYASTSAQKNLVSLGHYFNPTITLENKLGLAAASYELVQSIPSIVDYLIPIADAIPAHEEKLQKILLEFLNSRPDITIYGEKSSDPKVRVSTIAFSVDGWGTRELVETVEQQSDFGFRWGSFYSKRLSDEILQRPEEGVVRASFVHYNTAEEVKEFVKVLEKVLSSR